MIVVNRFLFMSIILTEICVKGVMINSRNKYVSYRERNYG